MSCYGGRVLTQRDVVFVPFLLSRYTEFICTVTGGNCVSLMGHALDMPRGGESPPLGFNPRWNGTSIKRIRTGPTLRPLCCGGAPSKVPGSQLFVGRRMVKESILPRGSIRLPTSLNLKGRSGWAAGEVLKREVAGHRLVAGDSVTSFLWTPPR